MLRVYVAGAYSADNVITVLDNMRKGMRKGLEVLLKGYSPFVPWFDYHFQFMLREDEELTVEDYYRYSMAWLEVSDVVLVLPDSEKSKGTQAEIKRAEELEIPVVYSIEELDGFKETIRIPRPLVEGRERKGGVNERPKRPRPKIKPAGQYPSKKQSIECDGYTCTLSLRGTK